MLCDTGPLVALVDPRQRDHARCRALLASVRKPLISTLPCWTEATHFVQRLGGYRFQRNLWELFSQGLVALRTAGEPNLSHMSVLMERYQNVPVDLADASLVALAEALGHRDIFTLDSDFRVYRFDDGGVFQILPESTP